MANFDRASRYLIREWPVGFFHWLSPRFTQAWRFRGWLDTSVPGTSDDSERACDLVGEFESIADPARRCLLDVESQTRPHVDMQERLGEYAYRLRRERRYGRGQRGKYQVLSVLLNLTGALQPNVLDMTETTLDGAGLRMEIVQRTMREQDAAATLHLIASGKWQRCVLPWIPLMRGGGDGGIIGEWKRLASLEQNASWRRLLRARLDVRGTRQTEERVANRIGGLERAGFHFCRWLVEGRGVERGAESAAKDALALVTTTLAESFTARPRRNRQRLRRSQRSWALDRSVRNREYSHGVPGQRWHLNRKAVWQTELKGWNMRESRIIAGWEKKGMDEGELKAQRKTVLRAIQLRLQNPLLVESRERRQRLRRSQRFGTLVRSVADGKHFGGISRQRGHLNAGVLCLRLQIASTTTVTTWRATDTTVIS